MNTFVPARFAPVKLTEVKRVADPTTFIGKKCNVIGKPVEIGGPLDYSGANLVYAGYPYNPYA
jgi:hypothetical protein